MDVQRYFWLGAAHVAEEITIREGKLLVVIPKKKWKDMRRWADERQYFYDPALQDQGFINFRAVFRLQPYFIGFWRTEDD
jgi:hypothetical protein